MFQVNMATLANKSWLNPLLPESQQVHIAGPPVFQRKNNHTARHQHREAAVQGLKPAYLLQAFTDEQNKLLVTSKTKCLCFIGEITCYYLLDAWLNNY